MVAPQERSVVVSVGKLVNNRCRPGRAVTQGCPTCSTARFILTWTGTVPQGVSRSASAVASSAGIAYSRTLRPPKAHAQEGAKLGRVSFCLSPHPETSTCTTVTVLVNHSLRQRWLLSSTASRGVVGRPHDSILFGVFSAPPAVPVMQQLSASRRWSCPTSKLWLQPGPGSSTGQECRF